MEPVDKDVHHGSHEHTGDQYGQPDLLVVF